MEKTVTTTTQAAEMAHIALNEVERLREHNAWLEAELKRYQEAGCQAVAERMLNQAKTISKLMEIIHDAREVLSEATR